jgi:quercetin 2,3-dioxygenase
VSESAVLSVTALGFPWVTADPFLFCAYHNDAYPAGDEQMAPAASLAGRTIGMDFEGKDGWRMYHGDRVPGFPRHPHRGFETITLARRGFVDHSDSLGAAARFGQGDVQWMTAGRGIVHAEMFPLIDQRGPNPTELVQVWLNLPRAKKLVEPYFSMLWRDTIPRLQIVDSDGRAVEVVVVCGPLADAPAPPAPPPNSWAADRASHVAIWTIKLAPQARWQIPAAAAGLRRTLYFFRGRTLQVAERRLSGHAAVQVRPEAEVALANGDEDSEILLLQGKPLNEPIAHYGPFVMNTPGEIQQAIIDYQRSGFGGWPWDSDGPVHPREQGRFARRGDEVSQPDESGCPAQSP